MIKIKRGKRVGLALGGGAARGLAHLGVIAFLQREGIPIHAVSGVSVGSIIAAGLAAGLSPQDLVAAAETVSWKKIGRWSFSVKGFNRNDKLEEWLHEVLPVRRFEELKIPLSVVATDLHSGETVVFQEGELAPAIRASCAIPGLYVPVEIDGRLLADGYLTCNLPIEQVRALGVDFVLASAIGLEVTPDLKLNNIYQILMRAFSIMSASVQRTHFEGADVVFKPIVERYSWADIDSAAELVLAGEAAAEAQRGNLTNALNPSIWQKINWNPFG